jgi:hypothetical protein
VGGADDRHRRAGVDAARVILPSLSWPPPSRRFSRFTSAWSASATISGRSRRCLGADGDGVRPAQGCGRCRSLFSVVFLIAALFNFGPVLVVNPIGVELVFVGGGHLLFVLRVIAARASAARQRAVDLARFQELKPGG